METGAFSRSLRSTLRNDNGSCEGAMHLWLGVEIFDGFNGWKNPIVAKPCNRMRSWWSCLCHTCCQQIFASPAPGWTKTTCEVSSFLKRWVLGITAPNFRWSKHKPGNHIWLSGEDLNPLKRLQDCFGRTCILKSSGSFKESIQQSLGVCHPFSAVE